MREIGYIFGMGFLASGAMMDIQYKSVPGWMLLIEGMLVVIYRILFMKAIW